nr:peptidylprolyl isomerase [Neptunicella marina]
MATVVEVRTTQGNFQVNLFDQKTPKTVENFLAYVNSGAFFNTVVHRSVDDFVMQTGGFQFEDDFPLVEVTTAAAVQNEPELSNVRGTLAMAKLGGDANSATSQWFVNLSDNSSNLDVQNGGFTVFGQVLGDGMDVVDAIAQLPVFNLCPAQNPQCALASMPLQDFTSEDANNSVEIKDENLVLIQDVVVIDADTNTHPELTPKANTLIKNNNGSSGGGNSGSGSGGGSLSWLVVLAAGALSFRRWRK